MLSEKGTDKAVYTLRVIVDDESGSLGQVFTTIDETGAGVGDIKRVGTGLSSTTRDIDILVDHPEPAGMVRVGGHPLQAVEQDLLQ